DPASGFQESSDRFNGSPDHASVSRHWGLSKGAGNKKKAEGPMEGSTWHFYLIGSDSCLWSISSSFRRRMELSESSVVPGLTSEQIGRFDFGTQNLAKLRLTEPGRIACSSRMT